MLMLIVNLLSLLSPFLVLFHPMKAESVEIGIGNAGRATQMEEIFGPCDDGDGNSPPSGTSTIPTTTSTSTTVAADTNMPSPETRDHLSPTVPTGVPTERNEETTALLVRSGKCDEDGTG